MARKATQKKGQPRVYESVLDAAENGSELEYLMAVRRKLALAVDSETTPAYSLPGLVGRFNEVSKLVEEKRIETGEHLRAVESAPKSEFNANDI